MPEQTERFGDREMAGDAMESQAMMAAAYNSAASRAAHEGLKARLMTLLGEEQQMAGEILSEMTARGWRTPDRAGPEETAGVLERYGGGDS